jgi:hypothetical protein
MKANFTNPFNILFAMIRAIVERHVFISLKQRKNQKKDPEKIRVKNRD